MDVLVWITVRLNTAANLLGSVLTPLSGLAGWFFATLAAVASGVIMLIIFKYTSKQSSIAAVRRQIKANLLALKLFKHSARVVLGSQWRIFLGVGRLLLLAIVPVAVMLVPTTLLLGQLALRYEARPLRIKEEAVVTLALNGEPGSAMPSVQMQPNDAVEDMSGPVRIFSKREVCWNVRGLKSGQHRMVLLVDGQPVEKELVVGSGLQPVSKLRPGWKLLDVLMHPHETPFRPEERVRSVEIEYPARSSWTSGPDGWLIYWFVVALLSGFCLRRVFNVSF